MSPRPRAQGQRPKAQAVRKSRRREKPKKKYIYIYVAGTFRLSFCRQLSWFALQLKDSPSVRIELGLVLPSLRKSSVHPCLAPLFVGLVLPFAIAFRSPREGLNLGLSLSFASPDLRLSSCKPRPCLPPGLALSWSSAKICPPLTFLLLRLGFAFPCPFPLSL